MGAAPRRGDGNASTLVFFFIFSYFAIVDLSQDTLCFAYMKPVLRNLVYY